MSVHDLTPITALGATTAQADTVADLTCTEVTDLALASVAARLGQEKNCASTLGKLLGAPPPDAGKATMGTPYTAVWMGPEQWMLGADFGTHEDIATGLKAELGDAASVTEQTDAWTGFDLTGDGIEPVMELLSNINLRTLAPGDAQRTTIHHLGCFVICGDPHAFVRILGPRASAGSLHHAIMTAMKSAL